MVSTEIFFKKANSYIPIIKKREEKSILNASKLIANTILNKGLVQLFATDNGRAFSMELGYRAGGLMAFHQYKIKDLVLRSIVDEDEFMKTNFYNETRFTDTLWNLYDVQDNDMFIFISHKGNEALLIDTALKAKSKNMKIIAVVNYNSLNKASSLHSSQKKLTDIADVIIDLATDDPDTLFKINEIYKINQISNIIGNIIAQMITVETYRYLVENGHKPPILLSANIKGADVHNKKLSDVYLGRWNA